MEDRVVGSREMDYRDGTTCQTAPPALHRRD